MEGQRRQIGVGEEPGRVHIVRAEDVMADAVAALTPVCRALSVEPVPALQRPSWNGQVLDQVYPWGTIRVPTPEVNRKTALELSNEERQAIRIAAADYLELFGYTDYV